MKLSLPSLAFALAVLAVVLPGCERDAQHGTPGIRKGYIGPEVTAAVTVAEEVERRACEARTRQILTEPRVAGAPALEAGRAVFLARTKAEPVYFVERPEHGPAEVPMDVQGYRKMLEAGWNAYGTVTRILSATEGFPKSTRDSFLRNGYLYAENPDLAYALVSLVAPHHLFGHDRIWIQRGEDVVHAERRQGRFFYADGPLKGQRVRLLLFDRAGGGENPDPPLHRDFRNLRYRLHFDRMQLRHVTATHVVANLRYGKWWVPSVLRTEGAHVELECEVLAPHLRQELAAWRNAGERRQKVVQALRSAMLQELDEALPFDEPLREYGFQLDGTLRQKWLATYKRGRMSFALNGDEYQVFDGKGRPIPPQVCVDFLTDTFERMSGTWWTPRGEKPRRVVGLLDFDAVGVDRHEVRRVPGFVAFAKSHPDWFEVKDDTAQIEMGDKDDFYAYLAEHADDFAPGDAVLIKGKTPWDPRHVHFHSFFIYETDPVTGMPLVVVGNAGRPSLRSWETEARRTPKRAIHHRIRPRTEWLENIVGVAPLRHVPPLAAGPE